MNKALTLVIVICTAFLSWLLPAIAHAQQAAVFVTKKDLEVAVRTFSFAYGMPKGDIDIEIVYDPSNAVSASEAAHIRKLIGSGSTFANRTIRARPVDVTQMGTTQSRFAYITHGLAPAYDTLMQKAHNNKMLTFSTDFECVDKQRCVMGVVADPAIKIEISRTATAASELEFSQALKLMIREVE